MKELQGHGGEITDLKFSPTNPFLLASSSIDKTISLWDCIKPQQVCIIG